MGSILSEVQKITKHAKVFPKVNKLPYLKSLNMTPHGAYSITTHVHRMTISDNSHRKKEKNPVTEVK